MIALLCLAAPSPPPPRAIHYVIRVSELEEVLEFTDKVLGMKVLRHEENAAACEITCNGDFDNAWSKTMVGYGPESEGYALELTYNYGVRSYKEGNALESILIAVPGRRSSRSTSSSRRTSARPRGRCSSAARATGSRRRHARCRPAGRCERSSRRRWRT